VYDVPKSRSLNEQTNDRPNPPALPDSREPRSGRHGVVYKPLDTHLDRLVAIKVLPPEKVADLERKRRFVQEANSASALNHPNIITIYDIASENGVDFIATG
jgi:serine/threonine protein kinase